MNEDLLDYIGATALVNVEIDQNRLNYVLQAIVQQQRASAQTYATINRRMQTLESVLQDMHDRQSNLENALNRVGGSGDELRAIKTHVQDLSAVVDNISRQAIPEIRRSCEDVKRSVNPLERSVQQLVQGFAPLEASYNGLQQHMEGLEQEFQTTNRQLSLQLTKVQQLGEERTRDHALELNRVADVMRDLSNRSDRLERNAGPSAEQRELYEELNARCNDNFRQVETSARAVDAELNRIRSDLVNTRTELNTLDNNSRQKITRVTDDMDAKFNMMLNLLRNFEQSSSELEEHLAAAGRALATSRTQNAAAPWSTTTTTTSALRSGALSGDVRRNVTGDLSDPRRGGSVGGY